MIINSIPSGNGSSQEFVAMNYTGRVLPYDFVNTLQLLSSGIFTVDKDIIADLFLVGAGGGGGAYGKHSSSYDRNGFGGGGGGGYTATHLGVQLQAGVEYTVVIGAGANMADGGSTSFGDFSAAGGKKGGNSTSISTTGVGGNGGSGGGGGGRTYESSSGKDTRTAGGAGGTNGGNGTATAYASGGTGQGTTTRAFGEANGELFASGGKGGTHQSYPTVMPNSNTGNGSEGQSANYNGYWYGDSGIVLIRFPDHLIGFGTVSV